MKFSIKDCFSKCEEISSLNAHLLKKSLMENFIFCAVRIKEKEVDIWKLLMPQHYSNLPQSNTNLRSLNCRESKPFKCFNTTVLYSFLFTRQFREYLFPKGVLIYHEKITPRSVYFQEKCDWRVDISL